MNLSRMMKWQSEPLAAIPTSRLISHRGWEFQDNKELYVSFLRRLEDAFFSDRRYNEAEVLFGHIMGMQQMMYIYSFICIFIFLIY